MERSKARALLLTEVNDANSQTISSCSANVALGKKLVSALFFSGDTGNEPETAVEEFFTYGDFNLALKLGF